MAEMFQPDRKQLEQWLGDADTDFDICQECEGLHLPALREVDGVFDSRLFVLRYGILMTTELEIRPAALLAMGAEVNTLNADYPTLKMFLDLGDETVPQLVANAMQLTGVGVSFEQFSTFLTVAMRETRQLAEDCRQMGYLFAEPGEDRPDTTSHALH